MSKTLLNSWEAEIQKHFGDNIHVLYFHSDFVGSKMKTITRQEIVKYDIVLTTYDVITNFCKSVDCTQNILVYGEKGTVSAGKVVAVKSQTLKHADDPKVVGADILFSTPWTRIIADESQRFSNPQTQTFRSMMGLYADYKWCLTGTPIRNTELDIWSQLRFCGYNKILAPSEWKASQGMYMKKHSLLDHILQRNLNDVGISLPPLVKTLVNTQLTGKNLEIYSIIYEKILDAYDSAVSGTGEYIQVLALFTRLRQAAIAPYLLSSESALLAPISSLAKYTEDIDGEAGVKSAKITAVLSQLRRIPRTEKVLIFSDFVSALDLVAYALKKEGINYRQLDGSVTGNSRRNILLAFRKDPRIRVLLINMRIGAEGLNLTQANHVILLEPWWNTAVTDQAIARSWRYGQEKPVTVHNLIATNTIEKIMMDISAAKAEMSKEILSGKRVTASAKSELSLQNLGKILGRKV